MLTFHPRFSKNVHIRDWPVVLPPHGPVYKSNSKSKAFKSRKQKNSTQINFIDKQIEKSKNFDHASQKCSMSSNRSHKRQSYTSIDNDNNSNVIRCFVNKSALQNNIASVCMVFVWCLYDEYKCEITSEQRISVYRLHFKRFQ